jgi:hypothetical protein
MTEMSKHKWIWMPHAGHFCASHRCRFHLNTYVNGYIISTVGELDWDSNIKRAFAANRGRWPKLEIDNDGKVVQVQEISDEQRTQLLSLKGDAFDEAYLCIFGYEDLGLNRKYETMIFQAIPRKEHLCCPWKADQEILEMEGYNSAEDAYKGHLHLCEEWDKKEPPK